MEVLLLANKSALKVEAITYLYVKKLSCIGNIAICHDCCATIQKEFYAYYGMIFLLNLCFLYIYLFYDQDVFL